MEDSYIWLMNMLNVILDNKWGYKMNNRNLKEKNNTMKFSLSIIAVIVMTGAIVTYFMYSLIQDSFFKTTITHEMELMQIMEDLGSQLLDSRLDDLKSETENIAEEYSETLIYATDAEIKQTLLRLTSDNNERMVYMTKDKQFYSSQLHENDLLQIDLTQVWEGNTVIFSPDFNEKGTYVMAIATPVLTNEQEEAVAGVLIEYVDGYCLSYWMAELFSSLDFGTAYIVDEEGRNIGTAREENYDWITTRYNAQKLAAENDDEAVKSVAQLEKRAINGEVGVDTYEWEGQLSYVAYGPLMETNWGFCVGFYGSKFEAYTREVTAISSRSAGVLLFVFLFFLVVVLIIIIRNLLKERRYNVMLIKQKEEIEQQAIYIAVSEERFRIAMQRSSDIIFEYQLESGEISCFYGDKEIKSGVFGDASLRDRLVEGFSMDEDAFGRFEECLCSISKGLSSAECMISGYAKTEKKWYKMSVTAITSGSLQPNRAVGILRDITGEQEAELDSLTRLYNKSAITEYVKASMQNSPQRNTSAFIMLDIDNFKRINDEYGHPIGDMVLCEVAKKLQTVFPKPCLCGRFGGDEFCVYYPKNSNRLDLENLLSTLSKDVKEIGVLNNEAFIVSISIGAVIIHNITDFEDIYKQADENLYKAKKTGRDKYCVSEIE